MKILSVIRSMFSASAKADGPSWVPDPNRRLTVYVGMPAASPTEWRKAVAIDRTHLKLEDGTELDPAEVKSYLITYPNNDALNGANLFLPFPPGVKFLEPTPVASRVPMVLNAAQMEFAKTVCRVVHDRFRNNPRGQPVYATTIKNLSKKRIRIQQFAGFRSQGDKYIITTVTGGYYTAEQFVAWYAASPDGWIGPGQEVADPDNYGRGIGFWAYFGETEDGDHFIATRDLPR